MTATGQELRTEGTEAVLAADTAPHRDYAALVHEAIDWYVGHGLTFDAEDVRRFITTEHPDAVAHSPNVLPAVFGAEARAGRIEAIGMVKPTRASRRHSRNLVWQGA